MKKNWMPTFLYLLMMISTTPLQGKTIAYSPSIPGQPLIFHTKKPTLSPIEKEICDRLSPSDLTKLSKLSQQISQELVGFIGTIFFPLSGEQQQNLTSLYLSEINENIHKITQVFLSSADNDSLSTLLEQTLTNLVQITNQMLTNSAITPNTVLFHENYIQMQQGVIHPFNAALTTITKDCAQESEIKAKAKSALEGLVSCISLYISNTNNVVNGNNPGSTSL